MIVIIDDGVDVDYLEFVDKIVVFCDVSFDIGDFWFKDLSFFYFDNYGMVCVGVVCVSGVYGVLGVVFDVKFMLICLFLVLGFE